MCTCNGSEEMHCRWHKRVMHLYDVATEMTDAGIFSPSEVFDTLEDIDQEGDYPPGC